MPGFGIAEALFEQCFLSLDGFEKLCQLCGGHRELLRMALPDSSKFLACEHDLLFRPAAKDGVVFRMAFGPLSLHESVGGAGVEGIVAYRDILLLDLGIAKEIGPVIEVVDLDAFARDH